MAEQPQVLRVSQKLHAVADSLDKAFVAEGLHHIADTAQDKFEAWLRAAEKVSADTGAEIKAEVKKAFDEFALARADAAVELAKYVGKI